MSGYKELREEWDYTETDIGLQGVRAFIETADGPDSLPEIGDRFDSDPTSAYCLLRSINAKKFGIEGGVDKKKFICTYSSRGNGGEPSWPHDDEQRTFQAGAEALSIPPPSPSSGLVPNWKWGDGTVCKDIDIFKLVPTGSFTRSIKLNGDGAKNKWFKDHFLTCVGKINDAEFENFREGSVYFSGCNGGAQYDKWGHRSWILECQFAWKLINGWHWHAATSSYLSIDSNDWLYLLRPDKATWDRPIGLDGKYLYETATFKDLF